MKQFALTLMLWSALNPCWAAINVCTETDDALANSPDTSVPPDGIGDGYTSGADLTASIQECWDNTTNPRYADPYIPAGNWSISATLVGPHRSGYSLRGEGGQQDQTLQDSSTYRGNRTSLIWVGAEGGTMMEIRGKFVQLSNMSFKGAANVSAARADVGLLITKVGSALSTGWITVDNCSFFLFNEYGVRNGSFVSEENCELNVFNECLFQNCLLAGFMNTNTQGLGNTLNDCRFQGPMESAIYATGGGKFTVNHPSLLFGGVDRLIKCDFVNGGFGPNNGDFTFTDVIIDNQTGEDDDFQLFEVNTNNIKLVFDRGLHSCWDNLAFYDYDGSFGKLTGKSSVTFNEFSSPFKGMVGVADSGIRPLFVFNNCPVLGSESPASQVSGDAIVRQTNCYDRDTHTVFSDVGENIERLRQLAANSN